MRCVAIYNSWDDWDLLKISIENIRPLVDAVIVVFSVKSNYGEMKEGPDGSMEPLKETNCPVFFRQLEPQPGKSARENETAKRNYGLELAKQWNYTHFLSIDSDEFYEHEPFLKSKEVFLKDSKLKGLVVPCHTYFAIPKLTIGRDITLVPFIHEITPTLRHGFNRAYPFAWDKHQIRIDPTRSLNINSGVAYTEEIVMHHYSWVRKDFQKKIRNSTARANLEKSCILKDLENAAPGVFCNYYQKTLIECENTFNLPVWEYSKLSEKE